MLCNKCGNTRDRCVCDQFVPPGDADAYGSEQAALANRPEPHIPWRVLAVNTGEYILPGQTWPPRWWTWCELLKMFGRFDASNPLLPSNQFVLPRYLQVAESYRNDPEAVEIINAAREKSAGG